jgi:uncharacterized membrane protein
MSITRRVYIAVGAVLAFAALMLAIFSNTKAWLLLELPALACLAIALLASWRSYKEASKTIRGDASGNPSRER